MNMPRHGSGRSKWLRPIAAGALLGLFLLLSGDGTVHSAVVGGIDPLEVLKLQIKNNVLFVFDTSGSMKWPVDIDNWTVGADDTQSRAYQAKRAVEQVVNANAGRMNYGIASYNVLASDKVINSGQNFDNVNGEDGPFIYVSSSANAAEFFGSMSNCQRSSGNAGTQYGFFCESTNTYSNYDSQTDGNELWRSFRTAHDPYPAGCTAGTNCRYYLESKFYRNSSEYHWNVANRNTTSATASSTSRYAAAPASYTCPNPPAGLTGNNPDANGDGVADQPRPCVRMCNDATANCANFYYSSIVFEMTGSAYCGGAAILNSVAACTGDNAPAVLSQMRNEAEVSSTTGAVAGLTENAATDYHSSTLVPVAGIRFDQSTPIGASLDQIRTGTAVFPRRPRPSSAASATS
jgi:hypothetical protein